MMKRRAAIYARLSDDRDLEAESIENQLAACHERAAQQGWPVVGEFVDRNISASKRTRRPGFEKLLAAVRDGQVNALIVREQARLLRNPWQLEELITLVENRDVRIVALFDGELDLATSGGRTYARIRVSIDKGESERLGDRVMQAKDAKARVGKRLGGGRRAFGYTPDLRVVPGEARLIEETARKLLAGTSLYRCVVDLNTAGVTTPGGHPWHVGNLKRMLLRPFLAGILVHDRTGTVTKGDWPRLITEDQHELLKVRLDNHTNGEPVPRPKSRRYILSGLVTCRKCGRRMLGSGNRYVCSVAGCGEARVDARWLEDRVVDAVNDVSRAPKKKRTKTTATEKALLAELRKLEVALDSLAENLDLDARRLNLRAAKLRERIDTVRGELADLAPPAPEPAKSWAELRDVARDYWVRRQQGTLTEQELAEGHDWVAAYVKSIGIAAGTVREREPGRVVIEWRGA